MTSERAMSILLASSTRVGRDVSPPPPIIPPLPPVPTCSACGIALGRYHYTETGADPSRKCLHCIEATPGRERMAAKRARRAKRAGVNHHGREA